MKHIKDKAASGMMPSILTMFIPSVIFTAMYLGCFLMPGALPVMR